MISFLVNLFYLKKQQMNSSKKLSSKKLPSAVNLRDVFTVACIKHIPDWWSTERKNYVSYLFNTDGSFKNDLILTTINGVPTLLSKEPISK